MACERACDNIKESVVWSAIVYENCKDEGGKKED